MCQMGFVVFAVFKLDFGVRLGSVLSPILFAVYIDDLARSCDIVRGVYIVGLLYADDILLLSPIVCELQKLLHTRERELNAQDLVINVKKIVLPTSRPTYSNVICQRLCSLSGTHLPWKTEIKYLGVQIVSSKSFKVSTEQSRCSFYRATNAIFGRIGRIATEDVVLHLLQTKCIPVLLWS